MTRFREWLARRAASRLVRFRNERAASNVRDTANAMRAALGLPGRL